MLIEVKVAILRTGKKHYEIARQLGWAPGKISQIISEVYTPDSLEKELLAEELQVTVDELFNPSRQVVV